MKPNSNRVRRQRNTPEVPSQAFRAPIHFKGLTRDGITADEYIHGARHFLDHVRVIALVMSDPQKAYEVNDRIQAQIPPESLVKLLKLNNRNRRKAIEMQLNHMREWIDCALEMIENEIVMAN